MRTVITKKGLEVSKSLKEDLRAPLLVRSKSRVVSHKCLPRQASSPASSKGYQTRYFRLVSSPPPKPRSPVNREPRARSLLEATEKLRARLQTYAEKKVKEMHEHSTDCELSFITLPEDLPSLAEGRKCYLNNLREEQRRKYGKSWNWLKNKRFSLPSGERKT